MFKGYILRFALAVSIAMIFSVFSFAEDNACQKLDSYLRYIPSSGAKAMTGELEIIETESEYSYELKAFDKLPLKFSLASLYTSVENTAAVGLPAHLTGVAADIETTLPFFNVDKAYLRLGLSPSCYGDEWSFPASSFRIPLRSFLIYQPQEKWTFLAGIAVYPDFQNEVLPVLGFIYKPNDRLTFNIVPERPNILYLLNEKTALFLEGGSSFNEYEVTKDNLENVVLRHKETRLGAGLRYEFNKFIRSSLSLGGIFNHSFKYRDSLGKVNIKDSLYAELRIEIKR